MLLYPFRDDSLAANYHLMANYRKSIMATFKFYIPAINLMGAGCLQEAAADIKGYGYRKALCSPPRKMKNAFAKNENTPQR